MNLVTLIGPPSNPKTSSPIYNPDARCAYYSNSPRHDIDDCWALKNKIQDLVDKGALEFTQDGQLECFCQSSKACHLKWQSSNKRGFCSLEFSICNFLLIVRIFIHVKLCYFINALHMSVLNQCIRIHYIQIAFIFVLFCDVQLSIKKL